MKMFCLNNISKVALATLKQNDTIVTGIEEADTIIVRSAEMKDIKCPESVVAIARAGAGVNNIPYDDYAKEGIVVFNTPGANANAVKELVLGALFLSSRDVLGGANFVSANKENPNIAALCEKEKKNFAGTEVLGKKLAVIGLGAIGVLVANASIDLGLKVIGYDPYLSTNNALHLNSNVTYVNSLEDAIADADFVTIHIPASPKTKGLLSREVLSKMKENAVLLNFSRDALVDEEALSELLEDGKIRKYVTDFANPTSVNMKNTICLPHLGASTKEAEDNCAFMAIKQLKDYVENGNITNSVNFPTANAGVKKGEQRICILHKNVPGMLHSFTNVITSLSANINTLVNQSRNDYAYTILDVDKAIETAPFASVDGVIRVRVL